MDRFSQRFSKGYDLACELLWLAALVSMLWWIHAEHGAGFLSLLLGGFVYSLFPGLPIAWLMVKLKRPVMGLFTPSHRPG